MSATIHLKPKEVWSFFEENETRLSKEMVAIAENRATEYFVYLTEEGGLPKLYVYKGDVAIYGDWAASEVDCVETTKDIYTKYLFPIMMYSDDFPLNEEEELFMQEIMEEVDAPAPCQEMDDAIYERADELHFATRDFLEILFSCEGDLEEYCGGEEPRLMEMIEDFLDTICLQFKEKHNISIYRPMWISDEETGEELFVEFPYDELEDELEDVDVEEVDAHA